MGIKFRAQIAVFLALTAVATPLRGGEPFPEFTFKRVKPPLSSAKKLITIQVDGEKAEAAPLPVLQPISESTSAEWFWARISPDLTAAGRGRFRQAADILSEPGEDNAVKTPRLQDIQALAGQFGTDLLIATLGKSISPALILAMIATEQTGSPQSAALSQVEPTSESAQSHDTPTKPAPRRDFKADVERLDRLLNRFDRDPILALAAFHAGEAAIEDHQGVPPFAATRIYVPEVIAAFQIARGLCLTPPELYSDGCVFAFKDQE